MLQANLTTSQTKKDTSLNAFDENCLSELSSEQASNIAGGFTLKNNHFPIGYCMYYKLQIYFFSF
jgi:hypothetical protein